MPSCHCAILRFEQMNWPSSDREWMLDCKWSAAKVQICSQTLLQIRIWGHVEPRQQSPKQERSWLWRFLREVSPNLKADIRIPSWQQWLKHLACPASICTHQFPRKSWKRACILLAVCFPCPCDAGQRNTTRMKERMGHNNFYVMLGPRTPCFDAAVVCDRRWACLQELKHFKTLKPGINSKHMELLHLGSDSTNTCGWS